MLWFPSPKLLFLNIISRSICPISQFLARMVKTHLFGLQKSCHFPVDTICENWSQMTYQGAAVWLMIMSFCTFVDLQISLMLPMGFMCIWTLNALQIDRYLERPNVYLSIAGNSKCKSNSRLHVTG